MTKSDKANWKKRKDSEDAGYDPKPWEGLHIHAQNTARHEFVKFCLCFLLESKDREWDSETQMDDGRVDVFDFGPDDSQPVVYEVETGLTRNRKLEKVDQYAKGPVRDVLVVDPKDVPASFADAIEYLDERVVIG